MKSKINAKRLVYMNAPMKNLLNSSEKDKFKFINYKSKEK